jgi:8-oxo-dGTP pyrophosphatase MutT (NUDIX family)
VLQTLEDLAPRSDTAFARDLLVRWSPPDAEQAATRDRIVAWIDRYPLDAHLRTRLEGHLTASALVVDAARERGLLTHHRKLGRWLQLGGHCDGDANLAHVALREAFEESGIAGLAIDPEPIDVDVHSIPFRQGARGPEPEHWHLDTRFVVHAPRGAELVLSEESLELAWVSPAELANLSADASVVRLFERVFGR